MPKTPWEEHQEEMAKKAREQKEASTREGLRLLDQRAKKKFTPEELEMEAFNNRMEEMRNLGMQPEPMSNGGRRPRRRGTARRRNTRRRKNGTQKK